MEKASMAEQVRTAWEQMVEVSGSLDTLRYFLGQQMGSAIPEDFVPGLEYIVGDLARKAQSAVEEIDGVDLDLTGKSLRRKGRKAEKQEAVASAEAQGAAKEVTA